MNIHDEDNGEEDGFWTKINATHWVWASRERKLFHAESFMDTTEWNSDNTSLPLSIIPITTYAPKTCIYHHTSLQ